MLELALRAACAGDADAIAATHIACWRETYVGLVPEAVIAASTQPDVRRALWERRLTAGDKAIVVVTDGDAVAGFACASPMSSYPLDREPIPGYDAYLDALYLRAFAHGRGLGGALVAHVAGDLIGWGAQRLALHVLATNPAVAFYRHCGAQFVRDEPIDPTSGTQQSVYGWPDLGALRDRLGGHRSQVAQSDAQGS